MNTERKERAIPYSAPMMRARRAGLKTMTRRVVKPQPIPQHWIGETPRRLGSLRRPGFSVMTNQANIVKEISCPYGQPGDRLWTREAWKTLLEYDHLPPREILRTAPIWYLADGEAPNGYGRYRHGRFMMRWMSRGLDEITGVRVERLQDISEADALAEGIERYDVLTECPPHDPHFHRGTFLRLWESINGPGSWALNPWVWIIEFKVITK